MSPFVTVEKRLPSSPDHEAKINGIFASKEDARRALGEERAEEQVYEWPVSWQPAYQESVQIRDGEVEPTPRWAVPDAIEYSLLKQQITHFSQMNESLQQYASTLEAKLAKKQIGHDPIQGPKPTDRRIHDLNVSGTFARAMKEVVAHYVHFEQPTLTKQIMMAPSADTVYLLNRDAQQQRVLDGSFQRTEGFAHNNVLLHEGDRIQFMKTDEELGVTECDLGEIVTIFFEWHSVAVALDRRDGGEGNGFVLVNLRDYPDLDLGYATTFERGSQMDIRQAFILGDHQVPTRQVVDQLTCSRTMIYADEILAATQFSDWMYSPQFGTQTEIDLDADPLGLNSPAP
jgi:hypothetical protein